MQLDLPNNELALVQYPGYFTHEDNMEFLYDKHRSPLLNLNVNLFKSK